MQTGRARLKKRCEAPVSASDVEESVSSGRDERPDELTETFDAAGMQETSMETPKCRNRIHHVILPSLDRASVDLDECND